MSDDSFIREVDEELRSERMQAIWKKYGKFFIAVAVIVVVVTAGYRYWHYKTAQTAATEGDVFLTAVNLDERGKQDEALAKLDALKGDGSETYKSMARLRSAAILASQGKVADAVKEYDAVAADKDADTNLQSLARLKAGMLLVDNGTVTEVEARVGPLAGPGAPYRASARETLGLAYYKAGDLKKAFTYYQELSKDAETPRAMQQRVTVMLSVIAADGGPVTEK